MRIWEANCACWHLNLLEINGAERNGLRSRAQEIGEAIGFHDAVSIVGECGGAGRTATATDTVSGAAAATNLTGKTTVAFAFTVAAAGGGPFPEAINAAAGDSAVSGSAESRAARKRSDSAPGAQAFASEQTRISFITPTWRWKRLYSKEAEAVQL